MTRPTAEDRLREMRVRVALMVFTVCSFPGIPRELTDYLLSVARQVGVAELLWPNGPAGSQTLPPVPPPDGYIDLALED